MTIVQALPLIRRADCRAYLLLTGMYLLFTPVTSDALLVIHHIPTGSVQCIAYHDLRRFTEADVEAAIKQFTPPQVDAPEAPEVPSEASETAKKRTTKRTKSGAVA